MDAGIQYDLNVGGDFKAEFNVFAQQMNALVAQLGTFDQTVQQVFTEVRNKAAKTNDAIKRISFQSLSGISNYNDCLLFFILLKISTDNLNFCVQSKIATPINLLSVWL